MTNELYPTKELSRLTGVAESTIRTWKSRGKLPADLCIDSDGTTLWKPTAIAAIQALQSNSSETESVSTSATPSVPTNYLSRYDSLAEVLGEQIAEQLKAGDFLTKVDRAVVRSLLSTLPKLPNFTAVCSEFFVEPHALTGFAATSLPCSEDKPT